MPTIYKCPNCGNVMVFDGPTQKLKCESCGTEMTIEEYRLRQGINPEETEKEEKTESSAVPTADGSMKVYHCKTCGAELLADENTSATMCAYCGNPTLIEDRLEGDFRPDVVIPFKLNRDAAVKSYKQWVSKGLLTPPVLKTHGTIEKIQGLYVPFWLYNYQAHCNMTANADRRRVERHGDYEEEITDHFRAVRQLDVEFDRIPADGSEKMDNASMDKMEPYDYSEIKKYEPEYMSGYYSEKFSSSMENEAHRAKERATRYAEDITKGTIEGYTSVVVTSQNVNLSDRGQEYALMPVWVLNCMYGADHKQFTFMMNGQTGKIVADRPVEKSRAVVLGIATFAATLLVTMIGGLLL